MISNLIKRSQQQKLELEVSNKVREKLIKEGYNPAYGARPLRRAVTRLVEDKIASKFLEEAPEENVRIFVDVDAFGEIVVSFGPAQNVKEDISKQNSVYY
jgi:ATP-dependent Clp protease ATP-binding subunit ClpC